MKKSRRATFLATGIALACIFLFVGGADLYLTRSEERVEQFKKENENKLIQLSESFVNTEEEQGVIDLSNRNQNLEDHPVISTSVTKKQDSKSTVVQVLSGAQLEISENQITFLEVGKDDNFTLSRMDAVKKAMECIPADVKITNKKPKIVLYALNTSAAKCYQGYAAISEKVRYYFTVNAMTGEVKESQCYELEPNSDYVWSYDKSKNRSVKKIDEYFMDAFDSIELKVGVAADCQITYGNCYSVSASCDCTAYTLDCEVVNKKLIITAIYQMRFQQDFIRDTQEDSGYISITIPKDVTLKSILTHNTDADLLMEGIQVKSLDSMASSSDYTVDGCIIEQAELESSSGDISFHQCTANELNLSSSCGDIYFDAVSGSEITISNACADITVNQVSKGCNLTVDNSCGSIEVLDIYGGKVNATNSCDDIEFGNIYGGTIEGETSCGKISTGSVNDATIHFINSDGAVKLEKISNTEVTIGGDLSTVSIEGVDGGKVVIDGEANDVILSEVKENKNVTIDVNIDYGDIEIECTGKETDYDYKLISELGTIRVGRKKQYDMVQTLRSLKKQINAETEDGNIELSFNR